MSNDISDDSDFVLLQSAMTSLSDITVEHMHIDRLADTTENLSALVTVAPSIEHATETDLFLVRSVAYMTTAGTDIQAKEITGKLTQGRNKRISVEGFKSFISSIWKTMLEAMIRMWRAAAKFFKALFGLIPRMRVAMYLIRKKLKDNPGYNDKRSIKMNVGSEIYMLSTNNKAPKDLIKINESLDCLVVHADFYYGEFSEVAKQVYDDVITGMESFDGGSEDNRLNDISNDALPLCQRNFPTMYTPENIIDGRFTSDYKAGPHLPNNKSVFIKRTEIAQTSEPILRAESIMANYVTVQPTKETGSAEEWKEREFFTPSASEIMMLLEKVELLLDKMKDYDKSLERIYELRDRLIESTNDLVERMEELEGTDMALRPYYRSAIRFNSYLTTAYIHPCSQIANIVFSASRAVIVLCQRAVKTIDPVVNPTA